MLASGMRTSTNASAASNEARGVSAASPAPTVPPERTRSYSYPPASRRYSAPRAQRNSPAHERPQLPSIVKPARVCELLPGSRSRVAMKSSCSWVIEPAPPKRLMGTHPATTPAAGTMPVPASGTPQTMLPRASGPEGPSPATKRSDNGTPFSWVTASDSARATVTSQLHSRKLPLAPASARHESTRCSKPRSPSSMSRRWPRGTETSNGL